MPNDILCTAPRTRFCRIGRTRISATGASAAKMSQLPIQAATPTATIPAETVTIIQRSQSNPEARANSLNERTASAVTPTMNGPRPAKMAAATSGAIQSHE